MFRRSRVGCRKTTCDLTKVTYNMYSCDTNYMSREMMEIDGRESAKCQKSKLGDIYAIIEIVLNDNKTKLCIVSSLTSKRKKKREKGGGDLQKLDFSKPRERERATSL